MHGASAVSWPAPLRHQACAVSSPVAAACMALHPPTHPRHQLRHVHWHWRVVEVVRLHERLRSFPVVAAGEPGRHSGSTPRALVLLLHARPCGDVRARGGVAPPARINARARGGATCAGGPRGSTDADDDDRRCGRASGWARQARWAAASRWGAGICMGARDEEQAFRTSLGGTPLIGDARSHLLGVQRCLAACGGWQQIGEEVTLARQKSLNPVGDSWPAAALAGCSRVSADLVFL
jgi:hypothetical protein